ncbi:MAG: vanadium-dependent haloperoxidase, partial [Burkholderiales bacterium]|nr:vanadium-dependent haloperoxidase [Anaerolineae bacterium]
EGLFDDPSEETVAAIAALREEQSEARTADVGSEVVERSVAYGDDIAAVLLEWIAADGYTDNLGREYELPTGDPSLYVQTTDGAPIIGPYWGTLRPLGLSYAEVCHVPLNVPFSEDADSTFYAQADEVREVGDNLTTEQEDIARFWLDTPGQTGAPAGHWVSIETQLVEQLDLNLQQAAGMYALVNMSLADSFISIWSLKYEVMLLRPETYIREYIARSWQPYIQTPPFPEYPSGHSGTSAAAAEILTSLFGAVAFTDRTHIIYDHEPLQRSFTSFEAAASEAAISRMYGGIHYRAAIENGMRQGRCIGQQILQNVQLGPIEQGE